ncbi:ParB family chromosome partitioning protein [Lachnospiraceae bacterium A2]|nr:ParB family chromosome partitioning protein [Lachnospiraceae bacterium A2]
MRTDDKVAQGFGVGRMTVQRFIRLTELIPPILQMVDDGKIALTPAVELSFLKKGEQGQPLIFCFRLVNAAWSLQ